MEVEDIMMGVDSYAVRGLPSGSVIHDLGLTPHYLASLARHDCVVLIHMESYGCGSACVASIDRRRESPLDSRRRFEKRVSKIRLAAVASPRRFAGRLPACRVRRRLPTRPCRRLCPSGVPRITRLAARLPVSCRAAMPPQSVGSGPVLAVVGQGPTPLVLGPVRLPAIVSPYGCPDRLARRDAPLASRPSQDGGSLSTHSVGGGEKAVRPLAGAVPRLRHPPVPVGSRRRDAISPRRLRASGVGDGMSSRRDASAFPSPAARSAKASLACRSATSVLSVGRGGQRVDCCDGGSTTSAQSLHDISTRCTRRLHTVSAMSARNLHDICVSHVSTSRHLPKWAQSAPASEPRR